MSTIQDIAGTLSNSFTLNNRTTLIQGDNPPQTYVGTDGDIYFRTDGVIYAKQNGTWVNLSAAALPDADQGPNQIIISNGTNYQFYDIFNTDNTFNGINTFTKDINGTALKAKWADLAEYYETDKEYPVGTLVQFGGDKEITVAKTEVNAVISSKPGFILNSEMPNSQPIALCGRVPVRVIGPCNKFDYLKLSQFEGIAEVDLDAKPENIIARALENKYTEEESLVLCVVQFKI